MIHYLLRSLLQGIAVLVSCTIVAVLLLWSAQQHQISEERASRAMRERLSVPTANYAEPTTPKVEVQEAAGRSTRKRKSGSKPVARPAERELSSKAEAIAEDFKRLYRYHERLFAHVEESYQRAEGYAGTVAPVYYQPDIRASIRFVERLRSKAAADLEAEYINSGRTTQLTKRTLVVLDTYLEALALCLRSTRERGDWLEQAREKHIQALNDRDHLMDLFGGYQGE